MSSSLEDPIGPPRTRAVKSRIWTSQPKAGAQHWRCERVRPVLPIARGAEIFAERWTPLIIRNLTLAAELQRDLEAPRTLPYLALAAAQAARTARCRHVGTQAGRPRAPLRAHVCGPRPVHGLPVARRVGCALAGIAPRTSTPLSLCVDVPRAPPRPAPASTRRHPLRLLAGGARMGRPRGAILATHRARRHRDLQDVPGLDEDLYITAEAEAFVKWHAGQLTWAQATREGRINSTASRRWSEPSQPGTPAACSPTSGRSPVAPSPQADGCFRLHRQSAFAASRLRRTSREANGRSEGDPTEMQGRIACVNGCLRVRSCHVCDGCRWWQGGPVQALAGPGASALSAPRQDHERSRGGCVSRNQATRTGAAARQALPCESFLTPAF